MTSLKILLNEIHSCRECEPHLPHGPRPILSAHKNSRILIMGQAPGLRVHESGVPWNDPSGERLRNWLKVTETNFYDASKIAIIPMGFCYPGTGKSGDLPPRPECAQLWHDQLLSKLHNIKLKLVVGSYAQTYMLGSSAKKTLTETVRSWKDYRPSIIPLPHPSPRNNIWLKKNPWFEKEILPYLRRRVKQLLT
jgi:uracil-DNA glycosylase